MKSRFALLAGCVLAFPAVAPAQETRPFEATFIIRGVIKAEDATALQNTLEKVPAIELNTDDISPGEKGNFGHYLSPPFGIRFTDPVKTDLGAVAKAVAEARTPNRGEVPPSLNLVLFAGDSRIREEGTISALREALGDLNGVDARQPGGTVGNVRDATVSVRLAGSGAASLADILAALERSDLDFRVEKP